MPFAASAANVHRIVPGQAPQVYQAGFKTIVDIAFGPDGSLYVLQYASGPCDLPVAVDDPLSRRAGVTVL